MAVTVDEIRDLNRVDARAYLVAAWRRMLGQGPQPFATLLDVARGRGFDEREAHGLLLTLAEAPDVEIERGPGGAPTLRLLRS